MVEAAWVSESIERRAIPGLTTSRFHDYERERETLVMFNLLKASFFFPVSCSQNNPDTGSNDIVKTRGSLMLPKSH